MVVFDAKLGTTDPDGGARPASPTIAAAGQSIASGGSPNDEGLWLE